MATGNKNSFNFSIPTGLIVAAWIIAWPVGLVLTILRAVSDSYKTSANTAAGKQQTQSTVPPAQATAQPRPTAAQTDKKKSAAPKNKTALVLKIIGWVSVGFAAFLSVITLADIGSSSFAEWLKDTITLLALFALPGAGLLWSSSILKKRDVRMARIRKIIGKNDSFNLSKLAAASDTSLAQVRRDLQRLIDKGEFGENAYIDLGTNNFMRTPDSEADDSAQFDYKSVYGGLFNGKKKKKGEEANSAEENIDIKSDNDDFKTIIREIRRLNDEIEDENVSDRIYKIEGHTKNIFEYVSAHPEAMPQIRTFLNYYLPTTLKLLESYSRIEKVGVAGENMQKSKDNIEATLDSLEVAFKRQIDELFKSESLDISTDISVLETMMQKDGLNAKNDFDFPGYTDDISDELGGGSAAAQRPEIK